MFAGELRKAGVPAIAGPKTLVLRFPAGIITPTSTVRTRPGSSTSKDVLKRLSGQEWALRFELEAAGAERESRRPPRLSNRERERRALEVPLLSRIVSQLEGRLLKMDEGFGDEPPVAEPVKGTQPSRPRDPRRITTDASHHVQGTRPGDGDAEEPAASSRRRCRRCRQKLGQISVEGNAGAGHGRRQRQRPHGGHARASSRKRR